MTVLIYDNFSICILCLGVNEFVITLQSLQAHKSDNQQLKVKLRRLEEDNAKREKQIEELLDPTKVGVRCKFLCFKNFKGFKNSSFVFRVLRIHLV